jgi:hypothetical protein
VHPFERHPKVRSQLVSFEKSAHSDFKQCYGCMEMLITCLNSFISFISSYQLVLQKTKSGVIYPDDTRPSHRPSLPSPDRPHRHSSFCTVYIRMSSCFSREQKGEERLSIVQRELAVCHRACKGVGCRSGRWRRRGGSKRWRCSCCRCRTDRRDSDSDVRRLGEVDRVRG